ncbi:MAG: hypothetical protein GY832_23670 [Chloroflexi bacterium]|nr:hypothetical protein [Chloroflexota bacterium]
MTKAEISDVKEDVSEIKGMLNGTLPHLATKADMIEAISVHKDTCRKSVTPKSAVNGNGVLVKAIVALVAALGILGSVIAITS